MWMVAGLSQRFFVSYSCILSLVRGLQRDDFKCLYRQVVKCISQQEISCILLEQILKKLSGAGIRSKVQEHQHFRSWLSQGA